MISKWGTIKYPRLINVLSLSISPYLTLLENWIAVISRLKSLAVTVRISNQNSLKNFKFWIIAPSWPSPPKYIQSVKAFLSWDESERPPVWSHTLLTPGSVKWRDLITSCWVEERELRSKHFVLRRRLISLTCCFYGLLLIDVGTVTFTQMDMWSIQWISKNLVEEWQTETERLKFWGRVREATWFLYSAIVLFGSQAPWLTVGCIRLLSVLKKKKASSRTKVMKTLGWRLNKWL